jgi:hypothetical protein
MGDGLRILARPPGRLPALPLEFAVDGLARASDHALTLLPMTWLDDYCRWADAAQPYSGSAQPAIPQLADGVVNASSPSPGLGHGVHGAEQRLKKPLLPSSDLAPYSQVEAKRLAISWLYDGGRLQGLRTEIEYKKWCRRGDSNPGPSV